jgi:hypothetical protein
MENDYHQSYTNDDVYKIIRRALKNKPDNAISHQDLLKTAEEFGLNESEIKQAIREEERLNDSEQLTAEWLRKEKSNFKSHFITYLIIICALFFLNLFSGGNWWFQWPLFGWGIGLAFHFKTIYFPTEEEIQKRVNKMRQKKI